MRIIEIENKTYKFPSDWSELTLGKFQEVSEIKLTEEMDTWLKIVSVLSGIPEEVLLELPFTEFNKLIELVQFVNNEATYEFKESFKLDNVTYKFNTNISKMTTAEFIDLDTLLRNKEHPTEHLHLIMAIMFRPVDKKGKITSYNSDELEKRATLFKEKLTCDYVLSSILFSVALGQICLERSQDSLTQAEVAE